MNAHDDEEEECISGQYVRGHSLGMQILIIGDEREEDIVVDGVYTLFTQ